MRTLAFVAVLFLFFSDTCAQIRWQLQPSGGYYISGGNSLENGEDVLLKILGEVEYRRGEKSSYIATGMRLAPEIYGADNSLSGFYTRLYFSYGAQKEDLDWNITLARRSQNYSGQLDLSVTGYITDFSLRTNFFGNTPLNLNSGAAWQKLSHDAEQNYYLLFARMTPVIPVNPSLNFSWGGYAEYFYADRASFISDRGNRGWRLGPLFAVNYLKKYIFNFEYRLLLHTSQLTAFPSYEQHIRLLGGLGIGKRWYIFLLADYYLRDLEAKDQSFEDYVSLQLENQVFLKLSRQLNKTTELFLKSGYSRNNFSSSSLSFGNWQMLFGLSFKGQK